MKFIRFFKNGELFASTVKHRQANYLPPVGVNREVFNFAITAIFGDESELRSDLNFTAFECVVEDVKWRVEWD